MIPKFNIVVKSKSALILVIFPPYFRPIIFANIYLSVFLIESLFISKKGPYFRTVPSHIFYIMPIPAPPAGIAGVSSLIVATTDSVVKSVDATLVAF